MFVTVLYGDDYNNWGGEEYIPLDMTIAEFNGYFANAYAVIIDGDNL